MSYQRLPSPLWVVYLFVISFSFGCRDKKGVEPPVNKCITTACLYGGTCDSAAARCFCVPGYEGASCQTESRYKFLGNWTVFEKGSSSSRAQYAISIQTGSGDVGNVNIQNFNNYFQSMVKGVVHNDTLYIPQQQLEGKVVKGFGIIFSSTAFGQWGQATVRYDIIDTATNLANDYGYLGTSGADPSSWNK